MSGPRFLSGGAAVRRLVQIAFLALFVGLVLAARYAGDSLPGPWMKFFFLIDPLVLAVTWLTTHSWVNLTLWALVTVAVTVLLGRVFCGWVCPFGTLHAIAGRVLYWIWPDRKRRDHWSPWQLTKYYVLVAFLVMAALGSHWICVLDPLVLLYRTTVVALFPQAQWALEESSKAIYDFDGRLDEAAARAEASPDDPSAQSLAAKAPGWLRPSKLTEPPYAWIRDHVFVVQRQVFLNAGVILAIFVGLLLLNRWRPRFWCRYICPLGALLGLFSWRPLLRRKVKEDCNRCDLCGMACHGAAGRVPGDQWKPAECFGCLNCTNSCRRGSLSFTFALPWSRQPAVERLDMSKRAAMASIAAGLGGLYLLRGTPQARAKTYHPKLIRPPGAREEQEFLDRCLSCGLCMKVCVTGGLQPTWSEAGLEGLWTPHLVPSIGHCEYNCTLCGHICPTEAIRPLSVDEKHAVKIGLASFDVTRCIPYAYGRDCIVCEEHCPVAPKAIYCVETTVTDSSGQTKTIKQPRVDPDRCVGCGICENVCPLKDSAGIRVYSTNETRHPKNQALLREADPY